jgi:hypothetical protein
MARTLAYLLPRILKEESGCWAWLGGHNQVSGYGYVSNWPKAGLIAHRVAYELLVGPIPAGMQLDHLCRNRGCVNPAHLEPVTNRENCLRGKAPNLVLHATGVCKAGHPATPENLVRTKSGRRRCLICERRWNKAQRDRKSAA